MINIVHQWGADYLQFDEPIQPEPLVLTSPFGVSILPGQSVTQIGRKRRSCFKLLPGHSMTYEGILALESISYGIFRCPAHDLRQLTLFDICIKYRYAFACVFNNNQFQCFLVGHGGPKGMRDIQLDYVE